MIPRRFRAPTILAGIVGAHLALLFVQVRHPEPFLNDSVLHFGLIRALASAAERGQSLLDPWVPTWGLGFPVFHYYQNLPHLLVLGAWKLSFETLSLVRAFKLVEWIAIGTLPIPVFLALCKLGFSKRAGLIGGALVLWIKTDYLHGLALESYVWQGLGQFTQAVGTWFLPLGLAWTYTALRDGKGYASATAWMTLTFLSHLALGYMGFMAAGLAALLVPREIPKRLARLALVAGATVAASAWVVVPILQDFVYYNVSSLVPSWKYNSFGLGILSLAPTPEAQTIPAHRLFRGDLFDHERFPMLSLTVGAGFLWTAWRARHREAERWLVWLALFFLLLFLGRPAPWGKIWNALPLGSGFHYSRAVVLFQLVGIAIAAVALDRWVHHLRLLPRAGWFAVGLLLAGVAGPLAKERFAYLSHNADLVREAARGYEAERENLESALAFAREDRLGRVYAGTGRPGSTHAWGGGFMVGWSPVYSWLPIREIDALGYLHHMWSLNADMHDTFREGDEAHYRVFNVRRILAPENVRTPPFARETKRFGRFRVLDVEGPGFVELVHAPYTMNVPKKNLSRVHRVWLKSDLPRRAVYPAIRILEAGGPIEGGVDASGYDVRFPPEPSGDAPPGLVSEVQREGEDFLARVILERPAHLALKMSYHPNWRVTVDGVSAETVHLMPSYVGVALEPGEHEVTFRYEPGRLKPALAGLGLLVLAGLFFAERRGLFARTASSFSR